MMNIQAALDMREEGFTYAQISYQTGISASTLKRRFKKQANQKSAKKRTQLNQFPLV